MKFHNAPFSFNTSAGIRFGAGSAITYVSDIIHCLGDKILIVTDEVLTNLGLYQPLVQTLKFNGKKIRVFDRVESDPSLQTVEKAIGCGNEFGATGVLGFGGGSSLDVAKLAALVIRSKENLNESWGVGKAKGPRLPLCLMPTTAGTGSEVTPISIITVGGEEKKGLVSPIILPDLAILDAELTLGIPPLITAATGIDAMVHAIEAFSSKNPNNNVISRLLAVEALRFLGRSITRSVSHGSDVEARGEMLMGSMLAGMAFANSPVAAVHALAYPIGGSFHVPHGLSNSLVLSEVMRFNLVETSAAEAYSFLAPILFPSLSETGNHLKDATNLADKLQQLAKELGLPTSLREVKIPKSACSKMAADAMKQSRLLVNNPRTISEEDAFRIYTSVW